MKYFLSLLCLFLLQAPFNAFAETEEEEMARLQRQLNGNIFGVEKKAPPPAPARQEVTISVPAVETPAVNNDIDIAKFANYQLAGVSLGKAEQAVIDSLQKQGYNCNMPQMGMAYKMLGKRVCVYISSEDPKMAMVGFANGQLRDLETHETYTTSFPEKFFKKAKDKFMTKYGDSANCKAKGKGEVCEVFGSGYRVLFRTEVESDDRAKIVHRIAKQ